ncbi:hypothetical protein Tco_1455183 [Tanacetum coccineum]
MENTQSVFDAKVTIRGTLHTLTSIKELLGQSVNERRRTRYKIGNNNFEFGRQEFCLITGFALGKIPKKVRVSELLELIRKPKKWYALSDEDGVKCLRCIPMGRIFLESFVPKVIVNVISRHKDAVMLKNKKNVSLTKKTKKIDSSKKIETYNVYGFVWSLKKDPLVIPRGLAWSKIGNFEKGDYDALFAEWSNPILCMTSTSTELLQPWLIRSMDYFRTLLVDRHPNGPITASSQGIQPIICAAVVHDPQFEQQPKEVVESAPLFTSQELVAEYHSITTSVRLIENVGDGDTSIADSAISNVLISEISYQNLVQEQLQSRDMCIQSITNHIVQHPLESPKGKRTESSISDVFHGELLVVETSKNEALSEEFDPKEYDKNVDDSSVGNIIFFVHY